LRKELGTKNWIKVQMVEIYKEYLNDLLLSTSDNGKKDIKIKESPDRGTHIEGLSAVTVSSE
jgi:hypothetical protein